MKSEIRAFLEKYEAENLSSTPPDTEVFRKALEAEDRALLRTLRMALDAKDPALIKWLRKALEIDDLYDFFRYINGSLVRGELAALYGLDLYFESVRKKTPETMEEMKSEIRAFFEKYDAGYRNIESIPPNTLGWLRRALETEDLEEFYRYIDNVGYHKGVIDALYGLQLYFEGEE